MKHKPHILLVNPWITDFAAYNFWIKPLGLLVVGGLLREHGFRVSLIDCLDFVDTKKQYGDGRFHKTKIQKPIPLKSIPRNYSRYGMPVEMMLKRLSSIEEPDLIAVTSSMTYWYPGVFETIAIVKKSFSNVPVILGGIYASLCYDHARKYSGADRVFKGGDKRNILSLFQEMVGFEDRRHPPDEEYSPEGRWIQYNSPETHTPEGYPAFDLYDRLDYVCMSTTRGCPFRCTYCATAILSNEFYRRDPISVVDEIEYWATGYPVRNIALYDEAFLVEASQHAIPIMKELISRGIHCHFHTPNALHVREINDEVAELLVSSGFKTIRLGFETSDEVVQRETGAKVNNEQLRNATQCLRRAGYSKEHIGVYVLSGLPGQRVEEVGDSLAFVKKAGGRPILVEYSPIPQTPIFQKAKQMSSFDLEEPLFHNNSLLPCQWEGFTMSDFTRLKEGLRRNYEAV